MIAVIEREQGYPLYEAVGRTKRALSTADTASFSFEGVGLKIEAELDRREFESWIKPDVARLEIGVEQARAAARVTAADIDRVFPTGGTSLIPRIRRIFSERFDHAEIDGGAELISIAHGLALIGIEDDIKA